ncbi:MAG: methionine synthase [Negativicutes bacterium]|nr:methionine synthase [Negativicutes bacterium]
MPEFHAPLSSIDKAETRRYAGLRGDAAFSDDLLDKACSEALILVKPKGCWERYRYDASTGTIHSLPAICLKSHSILRHLADTVEVAVLAVTIGPLLEEAVAEHFAAGDYTFGLLLDSAGSAAVEAVANAVNGLITDQASRSGLSSLFRFSPGYGDWEITDQPQILDLSGGRRLGIEVTASCMLLPRKSVTAVVGLKTTKGENTTTGCKPEGCQACLQRNCPARKENPQ